MHIESNGRGTFTCYLPDAPHYGRVEWEMGTHTANVYDYYDSNVDVFTFAWHKNRASMLDFTTALESYLSEE